MSIDFNEFRKINGSGNTKNKILEFLKKEKDKAFQYRELAKLLNESERTINAYLSILKSEGKVLHKQPYWAFNRKYSELTDNEIKETRIGKVIPSMFKYEGDGIFVLINNSLIKINLNGSIKMVEAELAKNSLWSQNIVGFCYLLRKKVGLLNKRNYDLSLHSNQPPTVKLNPAMHQKKDVSLRQALINLLKSEDKIFDLQEIYIKIEDFYNVTEYQRELDPKYPYPRIQHEIRSHLKKLIDGKIIVNISRGKYRIKNH